jgi:thiol-disulfide isomerase/thioredoxin
MRMRVFLALVTVWGAGQRLVVAQEVTRVSPDAPGVVRPYIASVTDPACPVTDGAAPLPVTNDLHVLYFPTALPAKISAPKSLVLHIAFDQGLWESDFQNLPFTQREDRVWQASVPLRAWKNKYAIYWIEEPSSKQVDTNDGKYFEVFFCTPRGEHPDQTIEFRALSYFGRLEPHGFNRPANYGKAIEILEESIHPPHRGGWLISSLWMAKLMAGGETPETKADLVKDIGQFVHDHSEDNFGLVDAMNFVAYRAWVPVELGNELADAIQKHEPHESRFDPHLMLLAGRNSVEKDEAKHLQGMREIIAKYPDSEDAESARRSLFLDTPDLAEREQLYEWLRVKYPSKSLYREQLAEAYLSANVKLERAMELADEADTLLDEDLADPASNVDRKNCAQEEKKSNRVLRADLLARTGKAKEAVALLLPLESEFHRAHSFFVLGTALEEVGRRREALDAYLEASVRPGQSQREGSDAADRLWIALKMGSKARIVKREEELNDEAFRKEGYKPTIISRQAPELDVITIDGEHFNLASLHGKPAVLNFWATWCGPCVFELKGLEDFQAKHPEVVLLTMVKDDTEPNELQSVLKEQRVTALRISKVPPEIFDRYGVQGVPHTFVIDENGTVRVHHFEGLGDARRYLEADLAAIREAGTGR